MAAQQGRNLPAGVFPNNSLGSWRFAVFLPRLPSADRRVRLTRGWVASISRFSAFNYSFSPLNSHDSASIFDFSTFICHDSGLNYDFSPFIFHDSAFNCGFSPLNGHDSAPIFDFSTFICHDSGLNHDFSPFIHHDSAFFRDLSPSFSQDSALYLLFSLALPLSTVKESLPVPGLPTIVGYLPMPDALSL